MLLLPLGGPELICWAQMWKLERWIKPDFPSQLLRSEQLQQRVLSLSLCEVSVDTFFSRAELFCRNTVCFFFPASGRKTELALVLDVFLIGKEWSFCFLLFICSRWSGEVMRRPCEDFQKIGTWNKQEERRWDDLNVQMGRAKTTARINWLIIFPTEVWAAGNKVLREFT